MLKKFFEKNLQEPFFLAEIYKAQISVAEGAGGSLGTVKAISVFAAVYMAFCAYWYTIYFFNNM
ncbi:MAG: hypothetical protein K6T65_04790 [Peptococcaceae bacterium]|nr:hypothetical protein [Peptococcaceae bacterium]